MLQEDLAKLSLVKLIGPTRIGDQSVKVQVKVIEFDSLRELYSVDEEVSRDKADETVVRLSLVCRSKFEGHLFE